jgi:hypothetical protein
VDHLDRRHHRLARDKAPMTTTAIPLPSGTIARHREPEPRADHTYVKVTSYDARAHHYTADVLTGRHHGKALTGLDRSCLTPLLDLTNASRQDEIAEGLWMSGTPGKWLPDVSRFDLVVTCNRDAPPATGTRELRCTFLDVPLLTPWTRGSIDRTVEAAFDAWSQGETVLVRCHGGMNRSGLVTGLMLVKAGWSGDAAVDLIRERRWHQCLRNPVFERHVRKGIRS